ncbi:MAG: M20 family metallopeptidase [Actinomycetes bacterium]
MPSPADASRDVAPDVVRWRRHLHQHPELSFQETETADFVARTLESFGGIDVTRPTETSVMGRLRGARPGKALALRADMDGLPIQEENDFEFASDRPGVMHACGHDAHMAMLLGTAKVLTERRDDLTGEVRFLFQHAEELMPGGADAMIAAGVMDGVDFVLGAHVWSPLAAGKIGIVEGPAMAGPDRFWITIQGRGGHAALPHQTVDPIVVGAQVVSGLQQVASRNVDPLSTVVLSVTKFVGGTTHNVIPETVEMQGTVRTFEPELRAKVPELMERIVGGITAAHGADYELTYEHGYRFVVNEPTMTHLVEETVRTTLGDSAVEHMRPNMGGEDFSAFQEQAPGCFFFVGVGNADKGITAPHHHPRFTVDEDALPLGVTVFVSAAMRLLSGDGDDGDTATSPSATSSTATTPSEATR